MGIWGLLLNVIGIGKDALSSRAKLKEVKQSQEFKIIEAQTAATVNRITSNTSSDNEIDLITSRDKKYTWKDDIVSYLFLTPLLSSSIIPFILAFKTGDWGDLNNSLMVSYENLKELPVWYQIGLGMVVIDILGFRSVSRPLIEAMSDRFIKNKK